MSGQSRKTQVERRMESERALLESAVEVIANDGVSGVTFEALAEVGGFSRGLASSRFGTKANLIESVMTTLHERQEALVAQHGFDDRDGLDAVLGYVDMHLTDAARRKEARAYFMLLSSSVADATSTRDFFAQTHEAVRVRLEGWVRKGQASGTIRPEVDPASAALMIGCMLFGSLMQCLIDPVGDFEALRRSSVGLLRVGLGTQA